MKTLIIPDIHNRIEKVEKLLKIQCDERVFLGDYFHDFHDTPYENQRTARWVSFLLEDTKNHLLLGNHDLCHMFPAFAFLNCPGFSTEKHKRIVKHLHKEHWEKMKLAYFTQGFLCSHAGIRADLWVNCEANVEKVLEECDLALREAERCRSHTILGAGLSRGGIYLHGGIVWQDWYELMPIDGLNQIVGHTPSKEVRIKNTAASSNFCLDTHSNHYLIIEDEKATIYEA